MCFSIKSASLRLLQAWGQSQLPQVATSSWRSGAGIPVPQYDQEWQVQVVQVVGMMNFVQNIASKLRLNLQGGAKNYSIAEHATASLEVFWAKATALGMRSQSTKTLNISRRKSRERMVARRLSCNLTIKSSGLFDENILSAENCLSLGSPNSFQLCQDISSNCQAGWVKILLRFLLPLHFPKLNTAYASKSSLSVPSRATLSCVTRFWNPCQPLAVHSKWCVSFPQPIGAMTSDRAVWLNMCAPNIQ